MDLFVSLAVLIFLMILLIFLSGWFSGVETALTNLNPGDIAEMKKKREKNIKYIVKLKKDMDRTIVAILIGNNIVNILLAALAALIANALFQEIGVSIVIAIITFLIIIFGEITPKSNAIINSKTIAKKKGKSVYYLRQALSPFISMFIGISQRLITITGGSTRRTHLLVSDESIKNLATLGEEEGVIKSIERDIIHKVFLFGDRKIEDIMVPMDKVFFFEKNYSLQDAKLIVHQHGFTRIPVMNKKGKVIGLIYSKDLIARNDGRIKSLMRKPNIVSRHSDVTDIFSDMMQNRTHMAIVKNEKGRHIGIVTLEDILEEVVGEIHDEYFEVKFKKNKVGTSVEPVELPEKTEKKKKALDKISKKKQTAVKDI